MELKNIQNEKVILNKKLIDKEKKEKDWLIKSNKIYRDFLSIESNVLEKLSLKNLNSIPLKSEIKSLDVAFNMTLEAYNNL